MAMVLDRVVAKNADAAVIGAEQSHAMRIAVVFPAPSGPMTPNISPRFTANETPSSALIAPYVLVTLLNSRAFNFGSRLPASSRLSAFGFRLSARAAHFGSRLPASGSRGFISAPGFRLSASAASGFPASVAPAPSTEHASTDRQRPPNVASTGIPGLRMPSRFRRSP